MSVVVTITQEEPRLSVTFISQVSILCKVSTLYFPRQASGACCMQATQPSVCATIDWKNKQDIPRNANYIPLQNLLNVTFRNVQLTYFLVNMFKKLYLLISVHNGFSQQGKLDQLNLSHQPLVRSKPSPVEQHQFISFFLSCVCSSYAFFVQSAENECDMKRQCLSVRPNI